MRLLLLFLTTPAFAWHPTPQMVDAVKIGTKIAVEHPDFVRRSSEQDMKIYFDELKRRGIFYGDNLGK